uniref:F-box protein AT5G49610-like beta-propeller domain-containing protein n=2 Tax=Aegilops tauschii subsp. strangulata TaxID=200361 RepID=A0A453MS39_AEGTS
DNVEFVLLEMGRSILYLDVKYRTLRRVYELANEDRSSLGYIQPFMMPWPPVFPALKNGSARNAI